MPVRVPDLPWGQRWSTAVCSKLDQLVTRDHHPHARAPIYRHDTCADACEDADMGRRQDCSCSNGDRAGCEIAAGGAQMVAGLDDVEDPDPGPTVRTAGE
jgi:hypothetical protein